MSSCARACNYCGEDFTVVYTCKLCRGKFCKNHRHPDDHDCSSKKSGILEKSYINIEKSIESSINLLEPELDGESNDALVRNVDGFYIEEMFDTTSKEVLSENLIFEKSKVLGIGQQINESEGIKFADSDSEVISLIRTRAVFCLLPYW